MADNRLNLTALDFDTLKQNMIDFIKSDPNFTDYDFTGAALNTLIDILAYNTHLNAYYLNQIANESFLDTASRRNSVISKAKELNYTPRSTQGSVAEITVLVNDVPIDTAIILIPKNTQFSAEVDGVTYTFVNDTSVTITPIDEVYSGSVTINQGAPIIQQYTVDTTNTTQRFLITNPGSDTSSLVVSVQNSATDLETFVFSLATDITGLESTTNAYYLQEVEDDKYEVLFGDDVLSASVADGNIIYLSYRNSVGTASNGARDFSLVSSGVGDSSQFTNITISTTSPASGGAAKESLDSVKFNAPKHFETQNRAVTINDYVRLIKRDFANVRSLSAWGGEDNVPKTFGRVYVAIRPNTGDNLSDAEKTEIISLLTTRNVVSITPEIIDPDFTFIILDTIITYDPRQTVKDSGTLINDVRTTIDTYNTNSLEDFGDRFRYSQLTQLVDNTDISILNNTTSVKIRKTIFPSLIQASNYTLDFRNSIFHPNDEFIGAVSSTLFVVKDSTGTTFENCQFEDLNGILRIVQFLNNQRTIISSNSGTVDYGTGVVVIENFLPIRFTGSVISIILQPNSEDIVPFREQILRIDPADVTVGVQEDTST